MQERKVTIDKFAQKAAVLTNCDIDLTKAFNIGGASPIHMYFVADEVRVKTTYPECILLRSGRSYMKITQIIKIIEHTDDEQENTRPCYKISCGRIESLHSTITIRQP